MACTAAVPSRSASQILEAILSLPEGTEIELRAPVFKVYGEELDFVFTELRKKGCRRLIVDGRPVDLSEEIALEAADVHHMDAIVDRLIVSRRHEKAIRAGIALIWAGITSTSSSTNRPSTTTPKPTSTTRFTGLLM